MAKLTSKEKKQKKDIAKQIMDAYEMNYNDWLHQKHEEFIDENLMELYENARWAEASRGRG